ncbi:MAG: hypothetical protein EOP53_15060, partial [Sphingobacteriales bacterium]
MKKYIYIFTIAMLSMAASCKENTKTDSSGRTEKQIEKANEESPSGYAFNKEKPYPYETGIIEYKYTGDIEGTQTVYFKDFGRTLSVEEEYVNKKSPLQNKVKQVFINTPEKYFYVDMMAKQGYISKRTDSAAAQQTNL